MRFTTVVSLALLTAGAVAQNNVFGFGNNNNNNNNNNQDQNNNNNNQDNQNNNNNNDQNNNNNNNDQNNQNNNNNAGDAALQLDPANVQDGSNADGQAGGAEEGQAASLTDPANFINFCTGKTLTNGVQEEGGSCNGIPMGDIPSTGNMVSSIIVDPAPGQDLAEGEDITFSVQVQGLQAGSFTNPDNTYYSAPQQLQGGQIVGHTHVTVQDLGNDVAPQNPPDPQTFAFFKGINDNGNGNGLLSAVAPGGLPAGNYRVCTMTSASNHQPVLMPVAQRGAQDDCTKFTVGQGNNQNNNNNNNNNQDQQNQDNANQDQANQDNANQDQANQDQQNQDQANQDQANQDQANQDQQNQDQANQDQANQDQANQDQANQDQQNQDQQNQQNQQNNQFGNGGFGNGGFGGFGNRFGRNRFGRNRRFATRAFVA